MLGQHPDTTSATGVSPPGSWITPDGCFIDRNHPSRTRFLLAVAMGGDVDPAGDAGVEKIVFTIVQPTSPAIQITVTEQSAKKGAWWLEPHDSPLVSTDGQVEFFGYCHELDLTGLDEGTLYITAVPTMKSGQSSAGLPVLTVYNESQTAAGIRPFNRQVFLDPVGGNDSNSGWTDTSAVQTLAVAMDKARGQSTADASACVIQVMNDLSTLTATANPISTQGRWPLTFRSYGGRHKLKSGAIWDCVGSNGLRIVFEGLDFVDGGIRLDSGSDYRREIEMVGCKSYPSWWGQPDQEIRALAEDWLVASTQSGSNFTAKSYHCEHLGTYWGVWQDFAFDTRFDGQVNEAMRTTGGDWTIVACEFVPLAASKGIVDVKLNSLQATDLGIAGLTMITYSSYNTATDPDISALAAPLKGMTDIGLKLGGFSTLNGTYLVTDTGYNANGTPWVALAATASDEAGTNIETCRMSDGVTWATASDLVAINVSAATTSAIMQDVLVKKGFTDGLKLNNGGTKATLWNCGFDSCNIVATAAWTQSVLANLSVRGTLEFTGESTDAWTNTVFVDCALAAYSGNWPSGALEMANHWEAGVVQGQEASSGAWFVAEGLESVEGTLGTGKGWRALQGAWRPLRRSLSSWVTD
ncbi:MAG: hypothetical protein Unbinned767contig1000_46 [Prokaryotic dsDNA virus sp.]|nr:MAG: hypothetical protein Unbinned767contig1000_46 [Prokaryotic dsDNA virus sp.]|tara:strand:+ start:41054 stop:42970 length:1917 start_codon:yes stop_codon:yes gene_type:complete